MKIRMGFVSNSSTSSFLIYGAMFESYKISKDENRYSVAEKLEEESGMSCRCPYEDDDICIGLSWDKIGDDETGTEFKARIEKTLRPILPNDIEFGTQEAAWRN